MEVLERLQRIDALIQKRRTGTPAELAKKIGVSERTIFKCLRWMKSWGAPISFSVLLQSYYYTSEVNFVFGFMSEEEKKEQPNKFQLSVTTMETYLAHLEESYKLNYN